MIINYVWQVILAKTMIHIGKGIIILVKNGKLGSNVELIFEDVMQHYHAFKTAKINPLVVAPEEILITINKERRVIYRNEDLKTDYENEEQKRLR